MYKHLLRPILFLIPPESTHRIIVFLLKLVLFIPGIKPILRKIYTIEHPDLQREVFGIKFSNPIGLAAGFDKNARYFNEMGIFGFSFVEIGTVTPKPQPGNPKPRLFRLPNDKALVNRLGFNNRGVSSAKKNLEKQNRCIVIGGNIGKNTATPNENAHDDYLECFTKLYGVVDYFVVNVSCPNISKLSDLQTTESLQKIIKPLVEHRNQMHVYKPILLKVSPDIDDKQLSDSINVAIGMKLDGFVATNTTTKRDGLKTPEKVVKRIGNGGLSGSPITKRSTEVIRYIADKTNGELPIIGVGGILSEKDALEKLEAGATLIQLYTGFIYQGPGLAKKICKKISEMNIK